MKEDVFKYSKSRFLDYGLYNGKIGLCMGYFIYAREKREPDYAIKAKIILQEVTDHIDELDSYSLSNGLLGFGWAIEWMYKHDFIRIGTNTFLEDLDDEVYKLVVYNVQKSINYENGILAMMLYLYKRICSKSHGQNFYRNICNCECLSILIDRLYDELTDREKGALKIQMNWDLISNALILLSKVYALRINFDCVTSMMSMIINSEGFKSYYFELRESSEINSSHIDNLEWAISLIYEKDYLFKLKDRVLKSNRLSEADYERIVGHTFACLDILDADNKYEWKEAWPYRLEK